MTPHLRLSATIGLLAMLTACASTDPLLNENDWHPTGANQANIAAQVVNPADLLHGRNAVGGPDGEMAAAAVLRLRAGHVKPLPDSGVSELKTQASPSSTGSP